MYQNIRNIRVFAENNGTTSGFRVYLDLSGQRTFLIVHRHSAALYNALSSGVRVEDLCRMSRKRCRSKAGQQTVRSIAHLLAVIDSYIAWEYGSEGSDRSGIPRSDTGAAAFMPLWCGGRRHTLRIPPPSDILIPNALGPILGSGKDDSLCIRQLPLTPLM